MAQLQEFDYDIFDKSCRVAGPLFFDNELYYNVTVTREKEGLGEGTI